MVNRGRSGHGFNKLILLRLLFIADTYGRSGHWIYHFVILKLQLHIMSSTQSNIPQISNQSLLVNGNPECSRDLSHDLIGSLKQQCNAMRTTCRIAILLSDPTTKAKLQNAQVQLQVLRDALRIILPDSHGRVHCLFPIICC